MNTLEKLKSKLRKYLPEQIYQKIYIIWILFLQLNKKNRGKTKLISFTKQEWRDVVVDDVSFKILLDPKNGSVDKEIYVNGYYEINILKLLRSYIKEDSICLDIGSNIGQHALFMACVAKKGHVYAFEPIKSLAEQIEKSIHQNGMKNITVENIAISDRNDTVPIYINNLNAGMSTLFHRDNFTTQERIQTRIFSSFWNNRSQIDVIKMDVEGYEYYALSGMEEELRKYSPVVLFEFSPVLYKKMGLSSQAILDFMFDIGYKLYDIDKDKQEITRDSINDFLLSTPIQTNILCLPIKHSDKK